MKQKRKTELCLQLREVIAIQTQRSWTTWCPMCCQRAPMIAADDAALAAGRSAREIYGLVEAERLHFREDENGLLYICFASLQSLFAKQGESEKENIW
ncbi:MAG TPA: hypothetical protein VNO24_03485 [Blastocatellia bacterium]|nr:hypothetical protein [Blastocatellia bacterium]